MQQYPKAYILLIFNEHAICLDDSFIFQISRESIDAVKDYFRDDLQKSDWQLMVELKKTFQII